MWCVRCGVWCGVCGVVCDCTVWCGMCLYFMRCGVRLRCGVVMVCVDCVFVYNSECDVGVGVYRSAMWSLRYMCVGVSAWCVCVCMCACMCVRVYVFTYTYLAEMSCVSWLTMTRVVPDRPTVIPAQPPVHAWVVFAWMDR